MNDKDFGEIKITIGEFLKQKGISKNKLMNKAEMQRTQLNNYCNQKIQRLDMSIISKICYVLECDIGDILKYCPPNEDNEKKPNDR